MKLQPIAPKSVRLRILGHDVMLTITAASLPTAEEWFSRYTIDPSELGSIQFDLSLNRLCGEFETVSYKLFSQHDHEPLQYAGTWQVIPDYRQFLRIFRWWYNYGLTEALTRQTFAEAYGKRIGEHYWEKWCLYERSITKMIGYFGTNIKEGQKFLDMVMDAVARYEQREKEEQAAPLPALMSPTNSEANIHP